MNIPSVVFLLLASCMFFTIGQKIEGNDKCDLHWDGSDQSCFKNGSGYTKWECIDNGSSDDDGIWIKNDVITCEQGHTCQCTEGDWGFKDCDCYNLRKFPPFPQTGVVRWTGTNYRDDNWWLYHNNIRTVSIPGEIHKDNYGRFLHKWTDVGKWEYQTKKMPETMEKFEIIIPKGDGTFVKYTGDAQSKSCTKSIITYEPKFSSFYKEVNADGRTLTFQNSNEVDSLTRETWKLVNPAEDGEDDWTWKIDYDDKAKLAYPVKFVHRSEDGFGGELRITSLDYKYEPIKGKNTTFQLEDYCDKV